MHKFLMFPLYSLQFSKDRKKMLEFVISYGIIDYSNNLKKKIDLYPNDYGTLTAYAKENNISLNCDFDFYICLTMKKLNCPGNIETVFNQYLELKQFVQRYEKQFGKDAKVSIHRNIVFETLAGKFNFDLFLVYCGILKWLGNKPYWRITYLMISFAMQGFKGKISYYNSVSIYTPMTVRQIETRVRKLQNGKLLDRLNFNRREIFYSTRYKGDNLRKQVEQYILKRKAKRIADFQSERNKELTKSVKHKVSLMKADIETGAKSLEDYMTLVEKDKKAV